MTLILFRHAEKISLGVDDPPLTPRGENQSGKIVDLIQLKRIPTPSEIWTSNKKRTQMTAKPAIEHFKLRHSVVEELNEIHTSESFEDFFRRIRRFQMRLERSALPTVLAVTHLDWIAQFIEIVSAENSLRLPEHVRLPWATCQWGVFEYISGSWRFVQSERT